MTFSLPERIEIMEVCPRDGFQSVKEFIPTEAKIAILDALAGTGISTMEITSFVSPKAIPQMADAADVTAHFNAKWRGKITSVALVPNLRGAESALAAGVDWMNFVISASVDHNMANTRRTVEESIEELKKVCALKGETKLRLSVATSFACPFAGDVPPKRSSASWIRVLRRESTASPSATRSGRPTRSILRIHLPRCGSDTETIRSLSTFTIRTEWRLQTC